MSGEGSLQTLAEVAISLAGFGSLLVVLRRAPASPWSQGEGADLLIVVGGSLLVLFFALLPLPLVELQLSVAAVWRVSSALFAVASAVGYAAPAAPPGGDPAFVPSALRRAGAASARARGRLLGNAAGFLGAMGGAVYLLALVLTLANSSFPLVALVARLGTAVEGKDAEPPD